MQPVRHANQAVLHIKNGAPGAGALNGPKMCGLGWPPTGWCFIFFFGSELLMLGWEDMEDGLYQN